MKGNGKAWGRCCSLAVLAALVVSLCKPQMLTAQVSTQGYQSYGMFGSRTLGQPLVPRPSTFGGGIQTSTNGSFLYIGRPNGVAQFATPWRQADMSAPQPVVGPSPAAQSALNATASPQSPAPEYNLSDLQAIQDLVLPSFPEMNGREGASPAEPALGLTPGIRSPVVRSRQPYTRSPELRPVRLVSQAAGDGLPARFGIAGLFFGSPAE